MFNTFWMAGFESACHRNSRGERVDMLRITQHDRFLRTDYEMLLRHGFGVARESLYWHEIDRGGGSYETGSCELLIETQAKCGIQTIWSLCHYGWPDDVNPLSPDFVDRFAEYAEFIAGFIYSRDPRPQIFLPFNEISFVAFGMGECGFIHPPAPGRAGDIKRQLIRGTIAAIERIRSRFPQSRFLHVDPLINVLPGEAGTEEAASIRHHSQYETGLMLSGLLEPELGGLPEYLDLVGLNFYHANQWRFPNERIRWEDVPRDAGWKPLHLLLEEAWHVYQRPLIISETSHFGVGRSDWIVEVANEVAIAIQRGIPILGVCVYPIIDRPDWEDIHHWHNSGLWDLTLTGSGKLERLLNDTYWRGMERAMQIVHGSLFPALAAG